VHVFDAPWKHLHYKSATAEASPQFQKQFTDALRRRLEAFAQPVREQHASLKLHCAVHDATSDLSGITHFARSMNADLVALGTRGRTNLRDILLGSTAERVLSESRCSVLAVKPSGFTHEVPMTEPPAPPKRLQPRF
jgi:universal stress protein E